MRRPFLLFTGACAVALVCCAAACPMPPPPAPAMADAGGPTIVVPEGSATDDESIACANMAKLGCSQGDDCAVVLRVAVATNALSLQFVQCLKSPSTLTALYACGPQVRCAPDGG